MFWRKRVIAIAAEYPDVELSHMYVDNAAMQLVRNPKQVFLVYYLLGVGRTWSRSYACFFVQVKTGWAGLT